MEKLIWLGLPLKTWILVIIPTLIAGIIPLITALIINKRDDNNE